MDSFKFAFCSTILISVAAFFLLIYTTMPHIVTEQQVQSYLDKHKCKRTGQFVGRDAEPVWECDGVSYKSSEVASGIIKETGK